MRGLGKQGRILAAIAVLALAALAGAPEAQRTRQRPAEKTAKPAGQKQTRAGAIRLNNLGVAYMNQHRFDEALKLFEQAYRAHPQLVAARLNHGIALLNTQRYEPAREALLDAARLLPSSARAWYNLGLLEKNLGRAEPAREAFARAAKLDPRDADARYFLGALDAQLGKYEEAISDFQQALALNPFHASAEFGLARAYQRAGDAAKAREHLARFEKLMKEKLATPLTQNYGDQGKYSSAEQVTAGVPQVPKAIPVRFIPLPEEESGLRFADAAGAPEGNAAAIGSAACLLDYDKDGRTDVFLTVSGKRAGGGLYRNAGGRFVDVTREAHLDGIWPWLGCAAGDYDNDGWADVAIAAFDGVRLFRNQGDGTFRDVTESAGLRRDLGTHGVMFVDYDHDGDIDLYVSRARANSSDGNVLWRNNGNGKFTDWTDPTGLASSGASLVAVASDFNNDRAVDLLVTRRGASPVIYLNPREGKFRAVEPWAATMPAGAVSIAVLDFDNDGWMDVAFTHNDAPGATLWRNVEGKRFEHVALPPLDLKNASGILALDCDNDGWMDLALVGEGSSGRQFILLRNEGTAGFKDVSRGVALDKLTLAMPTGLLATDYDGDGDTDLLITQAGTSPVLLRNDGGNRNNSLRLRLQGFADNRNAIGAKVEVFAGTLHQTWEVQSSSGVGRSPSEILFGLGSAKEADIVRLVWPTGVLQDEIQLAARQTHAINEIDRKGSSCPILFAWNGRRYEFITDAIGPGIVGHWVAPGERNTPDPTEYIKVDGARVRSRRGRLSFRFAEPMEEVVYLDQVRLLAVDHPADVEVYPNEYFASGPPFPSFKVITSRDAKPPLGAWDDRGRNVLPQLLDRDRRYVGDFALAPFKGFAQLHWVELELGAWNPSGPLRLLLHGFTDYFTATSVYAAHQAGVRPIVPYVEAQDARGHWVRVVEDMGFPAGLARTMVADLTGKLPAGTRRIRIVTNLMVYWDQILVDATPEGTPVQLAEVPLAEARLAFRGYPRQVEGKPAADLTYIHEEVSRTGPYARHAGNYTRYGDVRALLAGVDDRFVIFGSGDEVAVEFDASALRALPPGWKRDYFFFADGFSKDMDFYAAYGSTVEPLPFHGMPRYSYAAGEDYPAAAPYLTYRLNENTREVSGRSVASLRFRYERPAPK